jgi:hypothetical protein
MLVREMWKFIHPRVSYSLRGIWYSWVNKFSYFLNPHAINVLLYRMKPRKHIYVKKHILSPLERCLRHSKTTSTTSDAFRVPLTFSCQRKITLAGKPVRLPRGWNMIFISRNMIFVLCDHVFWFLPIVQSN